MAVTSNTDGKLTRTTDLPVNSTGWSVTQWVRVTATEGSFRALFFLHASNPAFFTGIGIDTDTSDLVFFHDAGAGFVLEPVTTLTVGTPYYIAVKMLSATEVEVLWRADGVGSLSTTGVISITSVAYVAVYSLGTNVAGEEMSNAQTRVQKLWHAALSTPQLLAESFQDPPLVTADIDSYLTLFDVTDVGDDESGNNRDWIASGGFSAVGVGGSVAASLAVPVAAGVSPNVAVIGSQLAHPVAAGVLPNVGVIGSQLAVPMAAGVITVGGPGPGVVAVRRPRDRQRGREMRWRG